MRRRISFFLVCLFVGLSQVPESLATDFFFQPDTSFGQIGDTLRVSGYIGVSDSMRGFTVYMAYDTNLIDLASPVLPGSLIAGRQGLEFHYFDHTYQPNLLEVGGTVWSNDFWAGPGELFQLKFKLRQCDDAPITAPYSPFFVDAHGGFPPVTFHSGLVCICNRVPEPPNALLIQPLSADSVLLRWLPVTHDTLGRPLFEPVYYDIVRQQILPAEMPAASVAVIPDTFFIDTTGQSTECLYRVISETGE